jgi:hypothetical protein
MGKFTLTKQDIEKASDLLKQTNDSFYKNKTIWEVISKNNTIKPSIITILEEANKL